MVIRDLILERKRSITQRNYVVGYQILITPKTTLIKGIIGVSLIIHFNHQFFNELSH